jgi:hypothetical protein
MNPDVQRYLAGETQAARVPPPPGVDTTALAASSLARFGGALDALVAAGEITEEELRDWLNRMRVALGMEPLPCGQSEGIVLRRSPGAGPRPELPAPPPPPPLHAKPLRVLPGPDAEVDYFGGRLRITSAEDYGRQVCVHWRVAPLPGESLFAEELAATDRDTEGLPDVERELLRNRLKGRLLLHRLSDFGLGDDVGTSYEQTGNDSRQGDEEWAGRACFTPAPPTEATRITVRWCGTTFDIDLRRSP